MILEEDVANAYAWLQRNDWPLAHRDTRRVAELLAFYAHETLVRKRPGNCEQHPDTPLSCPTCQQARGGQTTLATRGPEHFSAMGKLGGWPKGRKRKPQAPVAAPKEAPPEPLPFRPRRHAENCLCNVCRTEIR